MWALGTRLGETLRSIEECNFVVSVLEYLQIERRVYLKILTESREFPFEVYNYRGRVLGNIVPS